MKALIIYLVLAISLTAFSYYTVKEAVEPLKQMRCEKLKSMIEQIG